MSSENQSVLIIDDEANMRHMLSAVLRKAGYSVTTAENGQDALKMTAEKRFDFILCDIKMPKMSGMEFLAAAREFLTFSTVIMMSAYGTLDTAVEAIQEGAYDYVAKPFKKDEVLLTLKKAAERERLRRENKMLKEQLQRIAKNYTFGNMVGHSKAMQDLFRLIQKVAPYDTTVLIAGESGTGKELVAQAIHQYSRRAKRPLISLNCGSIPESLLESELFGHEKGAFTGAHKNREGLFVQAHRGTLFLDEVGELPLALQVKLLRVLQDGEVRPIGAVNTHRVDVRVIAATAKNLQKAVTAGQFREDLFYRLNVLTIKLPALRHRSEDIPSLCHHFIEQFNLRFEKTVKGVSPEAMAHLMAHPWHGNVRELENALERAMVLADTTILDTAQFDLESGRMTPESVEHSIQNYSLKSAREKLEKRLITKALQHTEGNRTQAARLLEISHPSLLSKIKRYLITR